MLYLFFSLISVSPARFFVYTMKNKVLNFLKKFTLFERFMVNGCFLNNSNGLFSLTISSILLVQNFWLFIDHKRLLHKRFYVFHFSTDDRVYSTKYKISDIVHRWEEYFQKNLVTITFTIWIDRYCHSVVSLTDHPIIYVLHVCYASS